jgi:hypothetical protein
MVDARKQPAGDYAEATLDEFLALSSVWDYNLYLEHEGPKSTGKDEPVIAIYFSNPHNDAAPEPEDYQQLAAWKRDSLIHYRAVVKAAPAFPFSEEEEYQALNRMKMMGGSFARNLAAAWFAADLQNRAKLRSQFVDLLTPYVELYRNGQ